MLIREVTLDHPDAAALIDEVQQEYVNRYGGVDRAPTDPSEFAPPDGLFLVGYSDGRPVAMGGWRRLGPDAEIKRMYVVAAARGRGLARRMLAELERTAVVAGFPRVILGTGSKQPEAVELYRSSGYSDVEPFGYYKDAPMAIHLGKVLTADVVPGR